MFCGDGRWQVTGEARNIFQNAFQGVRPSPAIKTC